MLRLAGRSVDPVFQLSWRHHVGFIRDVVNAGSVEFVETAAEHVGLFFVATKAGVQRVIFDARASKRHFLNLPSGPLLTGEGLCHIEFQGGPEDAQNWFVGSADIKNELHQMRVPERLQSFFAPPAVLASEVGYTGKTINQTRFVPDSWIYLFPATLPMDFRRRCSLVEMFANHCTLAGSADTPLFICRDHSTPPLLSSLYGMGSLVFRRSSADNFGVLARGVKATDVHFARVSLQA